MRDRFIIVGLLLCLILAALSGFHRISVISLQAGRWVAKVPFGSSSHDAGRETGIDGRVYGPLTFATNGKVTAIADTYHQRLIYVQHGTMQSRSLAGAMVEDMSVSRSGQVLFADNRALTLWLVGAKTTQKVVSIPHISGYTEAVWRVSLAPKHRILVEWVRFGHGIFATHLDEYTTRGRFVRSLAESRLSREGLQPLIGNSMASSIKNFQVAPDGNIYVEPEAISSERVIRIYGHSGLLLGQVIIRSPVRVYRNDFLGINRRGWIYLAVNIDVAHKARVLVVDGQGQVIADARIAAIPVYAATYGRVLPSGVLYLDQSTPQEYRIREYQPVTRQVWRWVGW